MHRGWEGYAGAKRAGREGSHCAQVHAPARRWVCRYGERRRRGGIGVGEGALFSLDEQIVLLMAVASSALQAMGERWSQCGRFGQCTNCFLVQGRARIPRLEDLSTLIISPGTKPEGPCHYTWANRVGEVLSRPAHLGRLVSSDTGHDTGMLV